MFYCAVKNCDNRVGTVGSKTPNEIKFHRLPKKPEIKKLWIDAVKPSESKYANSSLRVCSRHFRPECYFISGWLSSEAVPTIFPDYIESNEIPIMPEIRVLSIEPKQNLVNQYPDYILHDLEECMKTNALPDFPEVHDVIGNNSSDMTIILPTPFRKRTHSATSTESTNQAEISHKIVSKSSLKNKLLTIRKNYFAKNRQIRILQEKLEEKVDKIARLETLLKSLGD